MTLDYATYLGGAGDDAGTGIALAASSAYVIGDTSSVDFPTTAAALDSSFNGGRDVFVTRLDTATEAVVYSTYLGGSADDTAGGLVIDASGSAYLAGSTASTDFPTTIDALDASWNGNADVFVANLDPSGAVLVSSTYLGGSGNDYGSGITADAFGVYVIGSSESADFPTTPGAFDSTANGQSDAFVLKLSFLMAGPPAALLDVPRPPDLSIALEIVRQPLAVPPPRSIGPR